MLSCNKAEHGMYITEWDLQVNINRVQYAVIRLERVCNSCTKLMLPMKHSYIFLRMGNYPNCFKPQLRGCPRSPKSGEGNVRGGYPALSFSAAFIVDFFIVSNNLISDCMRWSVSGRSMKLIVCSFMFVIWYLTACVEASVVVSWS